MFYFFFSPFINCSHITNTLYFLAETALQRITGKSKSLEFMGLHEPTGIKNQPIVSPIHFTSVAPPIHYTLLCKLHFSSSVSAIRDKKGQDRSVFNKNVISYQYYFPIKKIKLTAFESNVLQVSVEITVIPSPQVVHKLICPFLIELYWNSFLQELYLIAKWSSRYHLFPLCVYAAWCWWQYLASWKITWGARGIQSSQCQCFEVITKEKHLRWKNKAGEPLFTALPIIRGSIIF